MKKIAAIVSVGWLLVVGSVGASQVTGVEISYQQGSTVARIDVQGPVRFTHQGEVPKNGRPDRVIVDVLSATHELGAKDFANLPNCIITRVRSSQYAVDPEKIVRIVFDLSTAPVYTVDSDDKSITVKFSNKEAGSYATWSSRDAIKPARATQPPTLATKPAVRNDSIERDRLASLAPQNTEPKVSADVTSNTLQTPATASQNPNLSGRAFSEWEDRPQASEPATAPANPASEPVKLNPPPADNAVTAQQTPAPVEATTANQAEKTTEKTIAKAPESLSPAVSQAEAEQVADQNAVTPQLPNEETAPVTKQAESLAKIPAPINNTEEQSVSETAVSKPAPLDEADFAAAVELPATVKPEDMIKVAAADGQAPGADTATQRATARFRREAQSDKIRGTMIAEFPQRLVIKYQPDLGRDPFNPLVDQNRTYDDPVENRIPNVEGLKLVGILLADGATNRALFEDKAGFSYILQTGDKVRNGYVLRVEDNQVYFQIFEYGWSRTVALTMEY